MAVHLLKAKLQRKRTLRLIITQQELDNVCKNFDSDSIYHVMYDVMYYAFIVRILFFRNFFLATIRSELLFCH